MEKAFQRSFDNLDLGYIDLYLIHYPIAYQRIVENSRLPADDVNAFYVFPFEDGASLRCLTSQILYHVFSATRLFCNDLLKQIPSCMCSYLKDIFSNRQNSKNGYRLPRYMARHGKIG